jgi:hypothetical protein
MKFTFTGVSSNGSSRWEEPLLKTEGFYPSQDIRNLSGHY